MCGPRYAAQKTNTEVECILGDDVNWEAIFMKRKHLEGQRGTLMTCENPQTWKTNWGILKRLKRISSLTQMLAVGSTYALKTTYANDSTTPRKFFTPGRWTQKRTTNFLTHRFSHAMNLISLKLQWPTLSGKKQRARETGPFFQTLYFKKKKKNQNQAQTPD